MIVANKMTGVTAIVSFLVYFLLLTSVAAQSGTKSTTSASCRSNATHLAWRRHDDDHDSCHADVAASSRITSMERAMREKEHRQLGTETNDGTDCCSYESIREAQTAAYKYLRRHIMAFDLPFRSTLGFLDNDDDDNSSIPDGLDGGLVGPTIECALQAKQNYSWADDIPKAIYYEYVLNYANLNEARSNWRPLLNIKLQSLFQNTSASATAHNSSIMTLPDAVLTLNTRMWSLLAPRHVESIIFVGGQTPLIFDTMSVLAFGYASCTGLAILFVNALRTFGIPARVAGTPAWHQQRSAGNHNWVEVWHQGQWHFMEPSATRTDNPDNIDRDPCERWFCHKDRFNANNLTSTTKVFAARLETSASSNTFYRMAWEWENPNVPGVDVSAYYQATCSKCQ